MSRYRKIDVRIWNDAKFAELSHDSKLAFLFILTHPTSTALGAFRATISGLIAELGWDDHRGKEAFDQLISHGLILYDPKANLIVLPNFLRYNEPESPNVIKAWASCADLLPECELRKDVVKRAYECATRKGEAFVKAFAEAFPRAFPKGFPNVSPKGSGKSGTGAGAVTESGKEKEEKASPQSTLGADTGTKTIPKSHINRKKPKIQSFNPELVKIPHELETETFRQAWREWIDYRYKIEKPLSNSDIDSDLMNLAAVGPHQAASTIRKSIANGWLGLFPKMPRSSAMRQLKFPGTKEFLEAEIAT